MIRSRVRIELHHASEIGDCFNTAQSEDYPDELHPNRLQISMPRLKMGDIEISQTKTNCAHHDNYGGNSQPHGHTAAVFGAEIIDRSEKQNHRHRCFRRVPGWYTKISDARPPAQGGGHEEIRDEQKCADGRQKTALLTRGRVNTTAVREMSADDDVVEADDCRQRTYSENDRKRREASRDKGQAKHVSFACTPIAVKQCRGAFPVNITRPMHACTGVENNILYQLRHCSCLPLSIGRASTGKSFSKQGDLRSEQTRSAVPPVHF